ncbi:hypothetical protein [Bradyrhizobium sp. S3.9.1]|uniref:DUF6894 family protein n=1 Tax=Bradyrhizobium sp. S3.9.1 TaxID=3156431 RepID=UPI0033962C01
MIAAKERRAAAMRRYYFPIFHCGETQADEMGELFRSAELAVQYGARIAREIGGDPDYDQASGTIVIVVDDSDVEIARQRVGSVTYMGEEID